MEWIIKKGSIALYLLFSDLWKIFIEVLKFILVVDVSTFFLLITWVRIFKVYDVISDSQAFVYYWNNFSHSYIFLATRVHFQLMCAENNFIWIHCDEHFKFNLINVRMEDNLNVIEKVCLKELLKKIFRIFLFYFWGWVGWKNLRGYVCPIPGSIKYFFKIYFIYWLILINIIFWFFKKLKLF